MFSGAPPRIVNRDGTRNVFCPQCKDQIGTVSAESHFSTALCVVCQAANRGEVLPLEVIAQLRSKTLDVTHSNEFYDPMLEKNLYPDDPKTLEAYSDPNFFVRVISVARIKVAAAIDAFKKATPVQTSTSIAKAKRRKRIFDGPID